MRRLVLVSAVLAASALSGPRVASADAPAMCAAGTIPMSVPAWLLEATQDTAAQPQQLAPSRPFGTDEVLWCASGLDPRCQPVRTDGDGFSSALAHGLLAPVVTGRTSVAPPPVSRAQRFAVTGGARDGARVQLDRPPRS